MAEALGAPLREIAKKISDVPRHVLPLAVKAVETISRREVPRDAGGDDVLSGWPRKPNVSRWELKDPRITPNTASVTVRPVGAARGPFRILEDGRKAYRAGDSRASGVRYRKRTDDYVLKTRSVKGNVGATKGKGTFTRIAARAETEIVKLADAELAKALK